MPAKKLPKPKTKTELTPEQIEQAKLATDAHDLGRQWGVSRATALRKLHKHWSQLRPIALELYWAARDQLDQAEKLSVRLLTEAHAMKYSDLMEDIHQQQAKHQGALYSPRRVYLIWRISRKKTLTNG
jgi:hypothetical protein